MVKLYYFHICCLIVCGLLSSCNGCSGIREPEFVRMDKLVVTGNLPEPLTGSAEAVFMNPNTMEASIINTELDVYANDIKVGNISQTNNVSIRPNSTFSLPVTFTIDPRSFLGSQGLSGIITSALTRSIRLKFTGYCKISVKGHKYRIPVDTEQTVTVK